MKRYLKILSWIIGIFIIIMGVTNITTSPLGGILLTIAGLIILPPCYKLLKNKIAKYNKKVAVILCLCFSFISFYMIGSITTNEANAKSGANNIIEVSNENNTQSNISVTSNTVKKNNVENNSLTNNTTTSENVIENQTSTTAENPSTAENNITKTDYKNTQNSESGKVTNASSSNNNATTSSSTKSSNKSSSSSSTAKSSNTSSSSTTKSITNKSKSSTTESTTSNSATVYITDTGTKYHRAGCQYLKNSSHAISKSSAISSGYTACFKCKP